MAGQKTISCTYHAPPPPPPTGNFIVTGNINPNATGIYEPFDTFNGFPRYKHRSEPYYLFKTDEAENGYQLGRLEEFWWQNASENLEMIAGEYPDAENVLGHATVTAE